MYCQIWLEELALESNIIQAQEDIAQPGKTAGPYLRKIYMRIGRFFIDISGSMWSFRLSSCVDLEFISLLQWIAAGSSGKSMGERLGESKVRMHDGKLQISAFGDGIQAQMDVSGPRGPR